MELASVRALKMECKSRVRELWERDSSRRALGVRAQGIDRSVRPKTIAVGISASEKNDYKLALRIQHPLLLHSREVETIREMAKGEVDVRFIGSVRKLQGTPFQGRIRPLRIGLSVGHLQVTAGTLGAFVQDTSQTMILSNNHVLANENNAKLGDDVLQPGRFDGGTNPTDTIATLIRFIPLDFTNPNVVDCAVAGLIDGVPFDAANLDALGQLAGVRTTPLGMNEFVAKIGRTTGVTQGVVIATELDNVSVGYDAGDAVFDNQIEIQTSNTGPFSQGGDSGSLIVDSNQQAVGLLFAGSDTGGPNNAGMTYANPIDAVFRALSVTLMT